MANKNKPLAFEVFEQGTVSLLDLPEGTTSLIFACTNYTAWEEDLDVQRSQSSRCIPAVPGCNPTQPCNAKAIRLCTMS